MTLPREYIDGLIKTALSEDISYVDITTDYLISDTQESTAVFKAKADGVLCGLDVALRVFELLDGSIRARRNFSDGDKIKNGDVIAKITGKTAVILKGERTALNLLQHMSGVATATAGAVELAAGTRAGIADTRKTLPGMRALQKYAVKCGGGRNHRFNLSDGVLIKDNHIDAAGGITNAVKTLRGWISHMAKIEVETRNLDEVAQAVAAGADVIMLDNMSCTQMKQAVELINGRALSEASGNITHENLRETALTGVDIISIGALTHSVRAFDISLVIVT